jgi:hypothetical protein
MIAARLGAMMISSLVGVVEVDGKAATAFRTRGWGGPA